MTQPTECMAQLSAHRSNFGAITRFETLTTQATS